MTVKEIKAMIEGMNDDDKIEIFTKEIKVTIDPWSGHVEERIKNWRQIKENICIVKVEEN